MSLVDKYADPFADERVGVVSDRLTVHGGGEHVEATIAEGFNAPIYTLEWDPQKFSQEFVSKVEDRIVELRPEGTDEEFLYEDALNTITTTPTAQTRLADLDDVELSDITADKLIATSNTASKIAYRAGKPYITYVHFPNKVETDYFWEIFDAKESIRGKLGLLKRRWDLVREGKKVARDSSHLMCNSEHTKQRTHENWGVPHEDMSVVYPPIDVSAYSPGEGADPFGGEEYFLAAQRLEPYKNVHTLIDAAKRARKHIVFVGVGRLSNFVRREAQYSSYVHAFGHVSEERLIDLFRGAEATLQGTLREDFGIVPIESMACGTPCIVPASGGFLETVGEGWQSEAPDTYRTDRGLLLGPDDYSPRGLASALQSFDRDNYADPETLSEYAEPFGVDRFIEEVAECLEHV